MAFLRSRLLGAVALPLLLTVGCSSTAAPSTTDTPATQASESADFDLEGVLVDAYGDAAGGVAALTIRNGVTTQAAAGVADDTDTPLEPDALFRVGSVSKPFVATMILQMVDAGLVDLDAPLSTYVTDAALGGDISVRLLMSHRSGLPNYTDQATFFADSVAEPGARLTPTDVYAYISDVEPKPADTEFEYSNTNYLLLGQLIEAVDGTDLNSALQARITEPLGLDSTSFDVPGLTDVPSVVGGWSPGVLSGERDPEYASLASGAWAAGALVSSTADLADFLVALFGGELLSEAALDEMTDLGPEGYGLGIMQASLDGTPSAFAHGGGIPGFLSTMAIDPRTGDVVVALTNNDRVVPDLLVLDILAAW